MPQIIDSSENQWTKESGQLDVRPASELADPGPRGTFEPTPARSIEFALNISEAFVIDRVEDNTGEAQGVGAAHGMGEAQGVGVAQDHGVSESVGENDAILHIDSEDTDTIDSYATDNRLIREPMDQGVWAARCSAGVRASRSGSAWDL